jgi:Domain of unknown function (DUF4123)
MEMENIVSAVSANVFGEEGVRVFAILDGALIEDLLEKLQQFEPEYYCLYRGDLKPDMAEVAPYLVRLRPNTPFAEWVIEKGWGQNWGIFIHSPANLQAMRKHFRGFLTVYDSSGKPMLFRYYDPRVLRLYLPTCNPDELQKVFGPITSYLLEGEDPKTLLRFQFVKNALQQENRSLDLKT